MTTARRLRSTGITPLLRYYAPLRLPLRQHAQVMLSLGGFRVRPLAGTGLPVSLTTLSRCAIPFHPGEPDCCACRFLHSPFWFRPFRQVDRSQWCNEAEPGSLPLWLTASLSGTFPHLRPQRFR